MEFQEIRIFMRLLRYLLGSTDILFGRYPEFQNDTIRRYSAAFSFGLLIADAFVLREPSYGVLALILYGSSRFYPYFRGYRERWRF